MAYRSLIWFFGAFLFGSLFVTAGLAEDGEKVKPKVDEQRIVELTALIKEQPKVAKHYRQRAFEYAKGHAWSKAADDFRQIAQIERGGSQLAQKIGLFLVLAKDKTTHKQLCEEMVEVWEKADNAGDLERTAKIGALMPEPPGDLKKLQKLAEQSIELAKTNPFLVHHHRTLALVLYRMKKYDEALKAVREGDEIDDNANRKMPDVIICNRAIEAMCLAKQGKPGEAKKALEKAKPILEKKLKFKSLFYEDDYWHDWLIAKTLYDEAEALLSEPMKQTDKPNG